MITVGVGEEYAPLDPVTRAPVARAQEVRAVAGLASWAGDGEVRNGLLRARVEVATPVCSDPDEVAGHRLRLRHAVGSAAEEHGCRPADRLRHGAAAARGAGPGSSGVALGQPRLPVEPAPVGDHPRCRQRVDTEMVRLRYGDRGAGQRTDGPGGHHRVGGLRLHVQASHRDEERAGAVARRRRGRGGFRRRAAQRPGRDDGGMKDGA